MSIFNIRQIKFLLNEIKFLLNVDWNEIANYTEIRSATTISDLLKLKDRVRGFNRQVLRIAYICGLADKLKPTAFVETGTYLDETAIAAANLLRIPVFTIEISFRTFVTAFVIRIRLGVLRGIHQFWENSPDFLRSLISSSKLGPRPMFYLDAHWGNYCPLEDEFEIIRNLPWALVVVDDFQVPGKLDFGFYTHGGVALSLERIAPILRKSSARIFFPTHEAASESGHRRGTLIVAIGADIPANLAEWGFPFTLIEEYYLDEHRI